MCLDAHAHGVRVNHDLFQTPNQVQLTFTDQPTPPSYSRYPEGQALGETMPMWRVQTEGYKTHEGQLIGVVSRNDGFLDSPDTEWISGGVNSKGPDAVAIGRHGNFLHWGFAASPTYLTDEAKDVFVNAVHYIARFDGQAPIARKPAGTLMRSAVDRAIEGLAEKGIEAATRLIPEEVLERLGRDPERAALYLKKMRGYMRPSGWYELAPDEDLVEIGLANSNPAMLHRAVAMLRTDEAALGARLLERYTEVSHTTPEAWESWLKDHSSQLFFTEGGGYKWLVNDLDQAQPAASRRKPEASAPQAPSAESKPQPKVTATRRDPFVAAIGARPLGKNRYELTVEVDIFKGWHAYDVVPKGVAYTALSHGLELPDGVTQIGDWKRPASHSSSEAPGLTVFEGRLAFRCELEASDAAAAEEITCRLRYQVCDDGSCLPPSTLELTATLKP